MACVRNSSPRTAPSRMAWLSGRFVRSRSNAYIEPLQHISRLIGDWIHFYNHRRPHQALNMKTPAEAFALAV
ncbi:integrase core domain-containing protein [Comamonas thiooxydans]|uniref:integrase core domain-containing protein n=1 Tax=Comamonas thiooxydans TaxID=363952 RepID=UPI003D080621